MISRRSLLAGIGLAALGGCARIGRLPSPFSAGEGRPRIAVPANACDSHIHILDPRFPAVPGWKGEPVGEATVAAYRRFQRRIGTRRVAVVTPSTYGADNRATLDALRQFGLDARGVVVIDSDAPPASYAEMVRLGVCGIRVNFVSPQPWGTTDARRLADTARIAADLGWHIQIYAKAAQIGELEPVIARLPTPVVIDHLGYVDPAAGIDGAGHRAIRRLLANGRTWLKLSGPYISSLSGPPAYADLAPIARGYVAEAPDRMLWGSDWPHRGQSGRLPDDSRLLDLLDVWAPGPELHRILVHNPAQLYRFRWSAENQAAPSRSR